VLAQKEVTAIRDALIKKYPEKKAVFEKNTAAYLEKLTALDKEYQAAFADAKKSDLCDATCCIWLFGETIWLDPRTDCWDFSRPRTFAKSFSRIKKYIKTNNVSVIYFEASASTKVAKTLADETGVELAVLNPLESLTQKEQEAGENYVSVMKENLAALQKSIH